MIKLLLHGHDTIECAYYLFPSSRCLIDYSMLYLEKETLRQNKSREPKRINLGEADFLLHPYGSTSGYPFIMENENYLISFGEFNNPSFFVKFKCLALWQYGIQKLHQEFLAWANSVGLISHREESLSRIDFSFDYELLNIDFNEDDFISFSKKDARFRQDKKVQTFQFGKSDVVLRVYDKIAEIKESSDKSWFFELWERDENVWRIEWQVRKPVLKRFGIHTIIDLQEQQGDLLRYLAYEHDTLRIPDLNKNHSRWPLHPLWEDLQSYINKLNHLGIYREIDPRRLIEDKEYRITLSIYGYLKRLGALECVKNKTSTIALEDSLRKLHKKLSHIHEPMSWALDIENRIAQIRFGK